MVDSPSHLIVKKRSHRKCYLPGPIFGPYSFINISCGKAAHDAAGNSIKNMVEAGVVLKIIQLPKKAGQKISIGVASPWSAQVESIKEKLGENYQNDSSLKLDVRLIDEFQKGKVDVMIISTVGSESAHADKSIISRYNNALAKARYSLWILGNSEELCNSGSIWERLIVEAKAQKCFFHADEDKDLAKVILEVKKELDQLDDLIRGDSKLFRNARWKILISDSFKKSFAKIESAETKLLVLFLLSKVSTGWRPKRSCTAAPISDSPHSNIFREFKVARLQVICTIDIVKESEYIQVLKVWDLVPFHDIAKLVERLDGLIRMYNHDYLQLCAAKCIDRGSEFPMTWPAMKDVVQYESHSDADGAEISISSAYGKHTKVSENLLLMKFYSLSSGVVNNFISGCDGGDMGLPFELSEQEKEAVCFNSSCFILGRSGTGKTTVLTMKLYQKEQLYQLACEGFHDVTTNPCLKAGVSHEASEDEAVAKQDPMRQLFVTLNPRLCYTVKQHVSELKRFMCGDASSSQLTPMDLDDIISAIELDGDIPASSLIFHHRHIHL